MDQNKELKKAGLKVTLPRLKILQILQEPENQHISAEEVIKRLAAAQGIDVLNLVKSMEERNEESQQQQEAQQGMELTKQAGQLLSSPMADPSKNPDAMELVSNVAGQPEAE